VSGKGIAVNSILTVSHLKTQFFAPSGPVRAVDDVSFSLERGKTLGLVGESGCGKSLTALSILKLVPPPGKVVEGQVLYFPDNVESEPDDLMRLPPKEMRKIRGRDISMVFQEPMTALNPVFTIGNQISEAIHAHERVSHREAKGRTLEILHSVTIPSPEQRFDDYPHQLSGGLRQRAMIAMALVTRPKLLIADEPTTALDVTIQAQVLELLMDLKERFHLSLIFISHDLGVIASIADFTAVMYAGKIIEYGLTSEVLSNPLHPYTVGLLRSLPRTGQASKEKYRLKSIPGSVPDLQHIPTGCAFQPRCPDQMGDRCGTSPIPVSRPTSGRQVRCVKYEST
jgi:oligopeptide/dipeptide ABC transporter ATP-binding protein